MVGRKMAMLTITAAVLFVAVLTASDTVREQTLQKAIDLLESKGDLKHAMPLFEEVAKSPDRTLAARGLLYLAEAQQRQGSDLARATYERIIKEFGNQIEVSTEAQRRLKVMEAGSSAAAVAFKGPTFLQDDAVAISPDGRHLLGGKGTLRDLLTGEQRPIKDSKDFVTSHAVFSADGQQIAYSPESRENGSGHDTGPEIRTVPVSVAAGQGKLVFRNDEYSGAGPFGWSPDGKVIFAILTLKDKTNVIAAISVATGSLRKIKSLEWRWPDKLSLSPDGRYIAYDSLLEKDSTNRDIFLLSTDGSGETPLVQDPARDATPVWTPDGKAIVFTTDRSKTTDGVRTTELWTIPVADGIPQGPAELVRPKGRRAPTGPIFPLGFSSDGSFYYVTDNTLFCEVYTAEVDLAAGIVLRSEARIENFAGRNAGSAYSPDGKYFAYFSRRGASFNTSPWRDTYGALTIVIRTLATGEEREIPTIFTSASSPAWFPDGQSLVFAGHTDADLYDTYSLHRIDLNTHKELINRTISAVLGVAVSPDGKKIYYTSDNPEQRISVYDTESERETELFRGPIRFANWGPNLVLSPDGRQIAFEAEKPNRTVIMSALGGTLRELAAVGGVSSVRPMQWSSDAQSILVQRGIGGGRADALWWLPVDGGQPRAIGKGPSVQIESIQPGGKQISTTHYISSPLNGQTGVWVDPDLLTKSGKP